eukprot:8060440-Pyramimonas_sp.AAC.3
MFKTAAGTTVSAQNLRSVSLWRFCASLATCRMVMSRCHPLQTDTWVLDCACVAHRFWSEPRSSGDRHHLCWNAREYGPGGSPGAAISQRERHLVAGFGDILGLRGRRREGYDRQRGQGVRCSNHEGTSAFNRWKAPFPHSMCFHVRI